MKVRSRHVLAVLMVAALPLLPSVGDASVGGGSSGVPPRIDSHLAGIGSRPAGGSVVGAGRLDLPVTDDSVLVEVFGAADGNAAAKTIESLGGVIVSRQGSQFLAGLPPASLLELAGDPSVAFVGVPATPTDDGVVDQGVGAHGASLWIDAGFDGSGINVLVVDSAFSGLSGAQSSGDLPSSLAGSQVGPTCFGGLAGPDPANSHGTAVAEIVHDMAPGAALYLYRTCLVWDGPDIVRYVKAHDIDIVTQSLAYFNTVPLDGRDPWGAFTHIEQVVDAGALWFNSAGNYRLRHWRGTWTASETLDFGGGATTIDLPLADGSAVYLRWDDWRLSLGGTCRECASDLDLDLYLLDRFGTVVASSTTVQSSSDPGPPVEALTAPRDGTFGIQVRAKGGQLVPTGLAIDLFVPSQNLPDEFQVFAGSLNDVSTLDSVISVGAVCWSDATIRPYSSEGPTAGGVLKPDISAVDGVSTFTYGLTNSCSRGFLGTSAATPNAAGAAAVVMQASGARGGEARQMLLGLAVDLGPSGPDDRYGMGMIVLGDPPSGTCDGLAATIIALPGQLAIQGTDGADVIVGNDRDNVIYGGSGDDAICAQGGADLVYGQAGADRIRGGRGADVLAGGGDGDVIWGNGGPDEIAGGTAGDQIFGGSGGDSIVGGAGSDSLAGGRGDDTLIGGSGIDTVDGGPGTDSCVAEAAVSPCEL